ncbi:helix-turn-helix transcriptional regulator [Mycolicibacter algericus]|uniref:Helix-turn-helix domain-containing protein n=2 Tax=Mycolicibacter algericus TaxID=1288388 RepID=A0A7I9YGF1_MYCAL|nr:helix-turn-helix domain-containing protein [Mycolicibacter algericus]OQZ98691.1 hypothetical protein BST10_03560 [Mycolicibacter algericus DSM 45454]GFG87747.1 hypothetical protein MALGJ_44230 [Mycolicibacter algericus]
MATNPPTSNEYVSAEYLAQYLNVHKRTIQNFARRGAFKTYRLGPKLVRHNLAEVLAAMADQ